MQSKVVDFNLYQNKYLEDRSYINKQLNNKSEVLQNPILKTFQATIYYFADKLLNKHSKNEKEKSPAPTMRAKLTMFSSIHKKYNKNKNKMLLDQIDKSYINNGRSNNTYKKPR